MGKQAGMRAAVTLTGMTRQEDLHPSEYAPDLVVENLGGLLVLTQ
jgi:ribonucleotide monophosphatase NagD (HAD superfamily)